MRAPCSSTGSASREYVPRASSTVGGSSRCVVAGRGAGATRPVRSRSARPLRGRLRDRSLRPGLDRERRGGLAPPDWRWRRVAGPPPPPRCECGSLRRTVKARSLRSLCGLDKTCSLPDWAGSGGGGGLAGGVQAGRAVGPAAGGALGSGAEAGTSAPQVGSSAASRVGLVCARIPGVARLCLGPRGERTPAAWATHAASGPSTRSR
jgi:hypothetical protein